MESIETNKANVSVKLTDPKELTLILNGDDVSKILIDDIEIPFSCEIEVKNDIIVQPHGPFEMLMGMGRGPSYLQGECEITLTIRLHRLAVKNE